MEPLLVSPIKPISKLSMTLILNCTNNAISSSVFFSESKITATSPLVTTNWLFAFSISFYLLFVLFTFNLPTTPNTTTTKPNVQKSFSLYFANNHQIYVSNVLAGVATYAGDGTDIPSDEGIPVDTMIYKLSLGTPTSDSTFTKNGDEYVANTTGKNLLQSITTSTGSQTVNHLVVYGNPGYMVGSRVTQAAGISRAAGGTITQPGKKRDLSYETDAHVCDFWKIDDTTLSNLYGLQVGWRAGG